MSGEQHLPGYSIDDDDPYGEPMPLEPENESADDVILVASSAGAGAGDAIRAADATVSPSSQSVSTQPTPTPPSQRQPEARGLSGTNETNTSTPTSSAIIATTTTPSLPERPAVDDFADPKIAPLHAIFPDYDAALLYSVVDSVGGDQDRAVDALLAMSDPDHVPVHHASTNEPTAVSQTQLDEEFARRLLLEDEQQYAREQIARRQQGQQQQQGQFPYAQRTHAPVSPQQYVRSNDTTAAQQPPPQRDTMSDVQEQFSKLAETSKRTFTSLVSKVKAKVQEFDQSRNAPNTASPGPSTGTANLAAQPPSPVLDRHAQQAYYAPRAVHSPPSGGDNNHVLDFSLPPSSVEGDSSSVLPAPAPTGGRPASNIDPGKIGLLPKRPVSLANVESQPSRAHDDDEEELEYVENPFEEGKYS